MKKPQGRQECRKVHFFRPRAKRFRFCESWPERRGISLRKVRGADGRKRAPRDRDPNPVRGYRGRMSKLLHCVRQAQPCNLQRDRLVQERGTSMSPVAARGDGARPCPPKAQPSPPPRDLVQRSFLEIRVNLWFKYPVLQLQPRPLPYTDRQEVEL